MSETKSWYETGYNGLGREQQRIDAMRKPFRLYMRPGSTNEIVFIDDDPFCFYEHQAKMDGDWRNWFTCLKGVVDDAAPCCLALTEKSRYYAGALTIVQCTETTDKKGNKYQYEVQEFIGKLKTLKKFKRKKEERGSLAYCRYRATREDDKSPVVGDEFEFVAEVAEPDKLFSVTNYRGKKLSELWDKAEANPESMALLKATFQLQFDEAGQLLRRVVPFNYMELLKPKTPAELNAIFKSSKIETSSFDKSDKGGTAEDVPF